MAETLVKNPICSKCGEDARPKAQFCFACGGEIVGNDEAPDGDVSDAWFKDQIVKEDEEAEPDQAGVAAGKAESEPGPEEGAEPEEPKAKDAKSVTVKRKKTPDAEMSSRSGPGQPLKSAAQLRRRPKPVRSKQVEVVWTEKTESPNLIFLVFGLILVAISAVMFFLAIYLK